MLTAVSSSRNSFILHNNVKLIMMIVMKMIIPIVMILYLMKGSLPFCVSMCQGFGRARRSDTDP